MKNSIYLTIFALLISFSAHAEAPENTPTGAGVNEVGFEKCEVCKANGSSAPLQARKSYDALMPDNNSATHTEDNSAKGTK